MKEELEYKIKLLKNNIIKLNNKMKRSHGHKDYSFKEMEADQKEMKSLITEYTELYRNLLISDPELIRE